MWENTLGVKQRDSVNTHGEMAIFILVNSLMDKNMDKATGRRAVEQIPTSTKVTTIRT